MYLWLRTAVFPKLARPPWTGTIGVLICFWATTCVGAGPLTPADQAVLRSAQPGTTVLLSAVTNRQRLPELSVHITPVAGPQYLFADKPETFFTNGISLQEVVRPGTVRLYLYHVPETHPRGKIISVIIENLEDNPLSLRMLRSIFPKPGGDYPRIAQEALIAFLGEPPIPEPARIIPSNGRGSLDPRLDRTLVKANQLLHGIYEFVVDRAARISVLQCDAGEDGLKSIDRLPLLPAQSPGKPPASGAGRGRFENSDFEVLLNAAGLASSNLPARLILADGRHDPWIHGHDTISDREAQNVGNYGVKYRIRFQRPGGDGSALAVVFCKLEVRNEWCGGVAAAVRVNSGPSAGKVIPLPSDKPFLQERGEACVICKFPPAPAGTIQEIDLEYSPPGAACLPTPLLFLPYTP